MSSSQRLVVCALVVVLLTTPLAQSVQYKPNSKAIQQFKATQPPRPTKMQVLKAYAKGYGKAAVAITVIMTAFKALQVDKLFEMIFGKDTSVQDLQNEIMDKFDELEEQITTTTHSTIKSVSESLTMYTKLGVYFEKIDKFLHFLKEQTTRMHAFMEKSPTSDTMRDFAHSIVDRGNLSVLHQLTEIRLMVSPNEGGGLTENFIDLYVDYLQRSPTNRLCHLTTSPQQTLFALLRQLYYAEVAALALIGYGYAILADQGGPDVTFEAEKQLAEKESEVYSQTIQALMQIYLPRLERNYWTCDAPVWQDGVNFHELQKMVYGLVEYEYNVWGNCKETCNNFQTKVPLSILDSWPAHRCTGYLSGCQSLEKSQFCFSDKESRPYAFVKSDLLNVGQQEDCKANQVHSVHSYVSGFVRCEYCACLCHSEDASTHRYLSLMPQMSDIDENQVVVGVKFVKRHKVLYLQIMQAPMLPYAAIDMRQAKWREMDEVRLVPPDYFGFPGVHAFNESSREIFMKELEVPERSVVTGVKFVVKNGVVDLAIRSTQVDWSTGQMDPKTSFWMTETHDTYDTNDMAYQNQVPDHCKTPSYIDTASGQKFQFSPSNLAQTAGQHVVPYIDAQPVVPVSMVPLSGVGVTHKADDRCGGFISPVVFTVHEDYLFGEQAGEIDPF